MLRVCFIALLGAASSHAATLTCERAVLLCARDPEIREVLAWMGANPGRTPAVELIELRWRGDFPEAVRAQMRLQVVEKWLKWYQLHGRVPVRGDFGIGLNQFPFNENQVYGTGPYHRAQTQWGRRIFDSMEQAVEAFREGGRRLGIEIKYSSFVWRGGIPEQLVPEVRREAIQYYVTLSRSRGEKPGRDDFGPRAAIPFSRDRFFGLGKHYGDGGTCENSRIFPGIEYAEACAAHYEEYGVLPPFALVR